MGATILADSGATPIVQNGNFPGPLFDVRADSVRIDGFLMDGQFVSNARAVRGHGTANLLTVANCEIKQFTNHAVDVDGADCKVDNCHIHHNLWWDPVTGIQDAHGVTTVDAQRLLISRCTIHNCSGDAFQGDRGTWQDITIDQCNFYDTPLESDMAGFKKGVYVSENAIDTKHVATAPRARLTLKRSQFHSFYSSFIESSTLNLKEQADVVTDSCDVYDSHIGFRVRGLINDGGVWVSAVNCTIRDSLVAIRYEDDMHNLHLVFNTFNNCQNIIHGAPTNTPWGTGWIVSNNLLVGSQSLPAQIPGPANRIPPAGSIDPTTLHPTTSAGLLGQSVPNAVPLWYPPITTDKDGLPRSATTPTMGAYEYAAPAANVAK